MHGRHNTATPPARSAVPAWLIHRGRLGAAVALAAALLVPTACAVPGSDLGGDPCLLAQVQSHDYSVLRSLQDALGTLSGHVDALGGSSNAISANQDITETLTALGEFHLTINAQLAQVESGALPPETAPFTATLHDAVARLDTGTQIMTQAYLDAGDGDLITADAIAAGARDWMDQGRLLLAQAGHDLAVLKTYSPNC